MSLKFFELLHPNKIEFYHEGHEDVAWIIHECYHEDKAAEIQSILQRLAFECSWDFRPKEPVIARRLFAEAISCCQVLRGLLREKMLAMTTSGRNYDQGRSAESQPILSRINSNLNTQLRSAVKLSFGRKYNPLASFIVS